MITNRYYLTAAEAHDLLPLTSVAQSRWWPGDFAFILMVESDGLVRLSDVTDLDLDIQPDTDAGRWVQTYITASRLLRSA